MSLIEPDVALSSLLERIQPVGTERVALAESGGRVLAESLLADRDSPPLDVSSMDGYAIRLGDLGQGEIPIAGSVPIGTPAPVLPPGHALRIVTGAALPLGAEAVIPLEETVATPASVRITGAATVTLGKNVRRRGENLTAAVPVLAPGVVLTSPRVGALAAFGFSRPLVFRRVRVGVITSGDELVDAAEAAEPWQIRDSNGPSLLALLGALPSVTVVAIRRVGDDLVALERTIAEALEACDALVLSGGVSRGDRDFVPSAVARAGVSEVFHCVRQRPGKPLLGGIGPAGQPVLGLPGNPTSVAVTARCFAVPALRRLAGYAVALEPRTTVRLTECSQELLDLWWHRLVTLTPSGDAELVTSRSSGDLVAAARSDGFVVLPPSARGAGPWPYVAWSVTI